MSSPAPNKQYEPQTGNARSKARRAVDIAREINAKVPEAIFDAFWRDGELTMLFGAAGSYKSLLAYQLGDAIARGKHVPITNYELRVTNGRPKRRKVLYVDLVLTDRQFSARYGRYKFSANLYRDRPAASENIAANIAAWVRAAIVNDGFTAVIIDDLSMVSRTDDGTRETLALMRELRAVTVETGVPILVLADSYPSGREREVSERDLRRSHVLCSVADSVFAIGAARDSDHASSETRVIVQTRSRSGELVWTHSRPLQATIATLANGLLGLALTAAAEEFGFEGADRDDCIREVKRLHDEEEMTFRGIAKELGISKSTAQRLYAEWHSGLTESFEVRHEKWLDERDRMLRAKLKSLGIEEDDDDDMIDESESTEEDDIEDRDYLRDVGMADAESSESWESDEELQEPAREQGDTQDDDLPTWNVSESQPPDSEAGSRMDDSPDEVSSSPPILGGVDAASTDGVVEGPETPRHITDLDQSYDDYGNEIFVEEWNPDTGKPAIWYKRDRQGFSRLTRTTWGVNARRVEQGLEFSESPTYPVVRSEKT